MNPKLILSTALTVACGLTTVAQEKTATTAVAKPTPPSTAGDGLLNDALREQKPAFSAWDLGGQERLRFEFRSGMAVTGTPGAVDFSRLAPDNDFWLLYTKIHLGYNSPCNWFSVYAEGPDSRDWNDQRRSLAGTSYKPEEDSFDLQQA